MPSFSRRSFLANVGRGALATSVAGLVPLRWRGPAAPLIPKRRALDLRELVKWVRETPRERIVAEAIDRVRGGLSNEDLFAAIFLAGIEDVVPKPVGFKFHCVLVMYPVWKVASALPEKERVLPLFFALDNFKKSQADDAAHGDWTLPPAADESKLPQKERARASLIDACDHWDVEQADAAVTMMARSSTRDEIVETLLPYGMRDWTDIGHHAIYTANAFKTLDVVGWDHAEPVLRSLVLGLLAPGESEHSLAFVKSVEAAKRLVDGGFGKKPKASTIGGPVNANPELSRLTVTASADAAAAIAERHLKFHDATGDGSATAWTKLTNIGLELMMETPGLLAVHATTGIRALHELADRSTSMNWKLVAVLQASVWCSYWRERFGGKGEAAESSLASLDAQSTQAVETTAPEPPAELLARIGRDAPLDVAIRTMRTLGPRAEKLGDQRCTRHCAEYLDAARALLVQKGRESHDYKFFAAVDEISTPANVGDDFNPKRIAAATYYLRGPNGEDCAPVAEARAALLGK